MDNNSSKKIILSVIGVAILVIAVVGISFAFFTYANNEPIGRGDLRSTIVFNFNTGDEMVLDNHYPLTDEQGLELTDPNSLCTFSITGQKLGTDNVGYSIYAMHGNYIPDKGRFLDKEIYANIRRVDNTDSNLATFEGVQRFEGLNSSMLGGNNVKLGEGLFLSEKAATLSFEVRTWISANEVTIGDDPHDTYTFDRYLELYYSTRIKIVTTA